jgi:hypothetical protein
MFKYSLVIVTLLLMSGCSDDSVCCNDASASDKVEVSGEKEKEVVNLIPTAVILSKTLECTVGGSISYDGLTDSSDDVSISSYSWSIDGKDVSTNPKPSLVCESLGEKEICLEVIDDKDLVSKKECVKITVKKRPLINPTALINGVSDTYTIGDTLQADGSGSEDRDGEVLSYAWSFADANSSDERASFLIKTLGEQEICLIVVDNDDLKSERVCEKITVLTLPNKRPTAVFNPSDESLLCTQGETLLLDANQSNDSDGILTDYSWNIDNLSGQTPTFYCDTVGMSQICLKVTDDGNLTSEEVCKDIIVSKKANIIPIASIENLDAQCSIGDEIFPDGSNSNDEDGNITAYEWIVDGNETSAEQKPTFSCDTEGVKEICLTVTDNDRANSEKYCKTITAIAAPIPQTTTPPVAVISFGEYDGKGFIFDCSQSSDTDTIDGDDTSQNDKNIISNSWSVIKYYNDGKIEGPHGNELCQKWIGASSDLKHMDVNLSVTDDDGESSSTIKRYTFEDSTLVEIEITD